MDCKFRIQKTNAAGGFGFRLRRWKIAVSAATSW